MFGRRSNERKEEEGVFLSQIKALRGTKDRLPDEIYRWHYVEAKFRENARKFGFTEIRTPLLEHTELFARGIGDTTDVVEKQMYTFDDYGSRSVTLRPEGTAGVARAFMENKLYAEGKPTKLWYEIACFRYEKPQAGRLREFHQFGIEVFGSDDMLADAEVIAFADVFLRGLGISGLSLRINSIGCPECRPVYRKQLMVYFAERFDDLCDTCKGRYERNPMRIFDCKSPVCGEIAAGAPVMLESLCEGCKADFAALQENLTGLGVGFVVDPGIVRGLDYYTKTAFEFVSDRIGAQGAVCGGGRYDHLIKAIGKGGEAAVGAVGGAGQNDNTAVGENAGNSELGAGDCAGQNDKAAAGEIAGNGGETAGESGAIVAGSEDTAANNEAGVGRSDKAAAGEIAGNIGENDRNSGETAGDGDLAVGDRPAGDALDIPGVGFGLGIERLLMVMEASGVEIPAPDAPDALVVYIGEKAKAQALSLLRDLREFGLAAEMDLCARNLKNQFKYADRTGASFAVVIGDDELASGTAKIKDMRTGEQGERAFSDVAIYISEHCFERLFHSF